MHIPCVLAESFLLSLGNCVLVLGGTLFRSRPPSSSPPPSPNQSPPPPPPLGFDPEDKKTQRHQKMKQTTLKGEALSLRQSENANIQYMSKVKCVIGTSRRTDFLW